MLGQRDAGVRGRRSSLEPLGTRVSMMSSMGLGNLPINIHAIISILVTKDFLYFKRIFEVSSF